MELQDPLQDHCYLAILKEPRPTPKVKESHYLYTTNSYLVDVVYHWLVVAAFHQSPNELIQAHSIIVELLLRV